MNKILRSFLSLLQYRGAIWGRWAILIIIVTACLGLTSCEEGDLEVQQYEPSSPLPLRVGGALSTSIQTPTPSPTPVPEESPPPSNETEEPEEAPQPTPTPTPVATESPTASPTPIVRSKSNIKTPGVSPSNPAPILTPVPTSTPQYTPTPELQNTPTPVPPSTSTPEPSPKTALPKDESVSGSEKAAADTTTSDQNESSDQEVEQAREENDPIVTPYDLTIDRLLVCAKVKDRNPVDCGESFSLSKTGKVFTWMRVSEVKTPKVIKHVYYREDELIATVNLTLKYSSMRTWSQKTFKPDHTGTWKVVITTEDDNVIAMRTWTMTP